MPIARSRAVKQSPEEMLLEDMAKLSRWPEKFARYAFDWGYDELEKYKGPEEWQLKVLTHMGESVRAGMEVQKAVQVAVASGHGIGKTALVCWIILWALATRTDTRGVVSANTEAQLRTKTWPELAKWYRLFIAKHWFKFTATAIYSADPEHEKTWRVDMVPWSEENTEAFAGLHNQGRRILLIFDEASAIPDKIWEVAEGALTDKDTEIFWIAFGNPTRNTGRFHACFNRLRNRWNHMQIDSRSVSFSNKEQLNRWIEDYGEDSDFVRVRVKGEFPSASDHQFIGRDVVDQAKGRHLRPEEYNFAPVIIGVDRAWSGDDTKIYLRQGLMSKRLGTFNKGEDDFHVAGHIARWEDEYKADQIFIDFGYGTGVYSAGKQMGRKWKMVEFGGKPIDSQYANKRAEMWGVMRDWLRQGGAIPDIHDLVNDLIAPEAREIQTGPLTGKIVLESKEDMKKRSLDSPDDADALALTFAFPVMNKSQRRFARFNVQRVDYDPLVGNSAGTAAFDPLSILSIISEN